MLALGKILRRSNLLQNSEMEIPMYANLFCCDNDKLLYAAPFLSVTCAGYETAISNRYIIIELRNSICDHKNSEIHYNRFVFISSS